MDGLFRKVLKGIYPKIPTHYSEELNKMLKRLIAVNPNHRPNCSQILDLDIVMRYIRKLNLLYTGDDDHEVTERTEGEPTPNAMQTA